jgi:DDE superfamily endonuclease
MGARALTCFRQALMALVWFRKNEDKTLLGAGFGVSRATAHRDVAEAITVLAAQVPDLHTALRRVADEGWSHVILDGKLFATDRLAETTTSVKGEQKRILDHLVRRVTGQRPVAPSMSSRRMSVCPACWTVSLVMWASTQRSVRGSSATGWAVRTSRPSTARMCTAVGDRGPVAGDDLDPRTGPRRPSGDGTSQARVVPGRTRRKSNRERFVLYHLARLNIH